MDEHAVELRDILARLDAARAVADMHLPGLRLRPLKGECKGFWAVTVRANWRVIFRFAGRDAFEVDHIDYRSLWAEVSRTLPGPSESRALRYPNW